MSASPAARIGAVIRKELAEFRRNRFIVATSAVLPVVFLVEPTVTLLVRSASISGAALDTRIDASLFFPLIVPVFVPGVMSAFAVVGEREQGTLEPMLTTPISKVELLAGKAVAVFIPAVAVAYTIFGIFLAIAELGAQPAVASAVWNAPQLIAEPVFIPLLAAWGIWVGLGISAVASETRVAQQLSTLASLPPVALVALMSFRVITPGFGTAAALAAALAVIDAGACFVVARLFDRERLITGTRAGTELEGTS